MFHRDSNKELRVAKFVEEGDDAALVPEEVESIKMLTVDDLIIDLDLQDKMKPELGEMAAELGLKDKQLKKYDKEQLKRFITFMRKL